MNFLMIFLLASSVTLAYAQDNEGEILRLKKGEYYYHYLTGDFPTAMNQLQQWHASENTTASEADVMEAAMLLSLGLQQKAQDIFVKIKQEDNAASSQSWFYLARRWFELGEYSEVLNSIKKIDLKELNNEVLGEAQFMNAASHIELGEHEKAVETISSMPRNSIWAGLARHNLILKMFENTSEGQDLALLIENATFYLPDTEEGKNLRDRIHLISALHFLQSGKNRSAEKHLKSISLSGPYTPVALLQYGWAKVEQGQYDDALQPWRELQVRFNSFDPDVMESMLGVPHVLELMSADTQALNVYEAAEKRLLSMKGLLLQINENMAENSWLEDWALNQNDQSWGWQADIEKTLPFNDTTAVLQQLVSKEKIIYQMTEYRDLLLLADYLTEKEDSLRLWNTLVEKREKESKVRIVEPVIASANNRLNEAKDELNKIRGYLQHSTEELFALPNKQEEKRIDLLAQSAISIEHLMQVNTASRNVTEYQDRWTRVNGVFLWQMNEDKIKKQWQLKQQLAVIDQLIKKADVQLLETRLANQWSPASWRGMKARILAILTKTNELKVLALQAKEESKLALVASSKEHMNGLIARINDYLSQTRLSIARLYDEALQQYAVSDELNDKEQR